MQDSDTTDAFYHFLSDGLDEDAFRLLRDNANIPARNMGWSALYAAARNNCLRTLGALLEKGFDINEVNDEQVPMGNLTDVCVTPLFGAVTNGNTAAVEMLLQHGADMEIVDTDGFTPLIVAAMNDELSMVHLLLAHGADVHAKDCDGRNALHIASEAASGDMVRTLLAAGAVLDARCDNGCNALYYACRFDNVGALYALHEAGADLSGSDRDVEEEEETPLITACHSDSWDAALYLLDAGVTPNVVDADGATPLHLAAAKGPRNLLKSLIELGADIHARDGNGSQPIHHAARHQAGAVALLLAAGADVHAVNESRGFTPLHFAATEGNEAGIRVLLQAGADVHAREKKVGKMPLHHAAENNKAGNVRALLRAGADINARSTKGKTPLYYACDEGCVDSVRCLLKARPRADVNLADDKGKTPLDVATEQGCLNICKLLKAAGARNGTGPEAPEDSFPRFRNMINDILANHGKDWLQGLPAQHRMEDRHFTHHEGRQSLQDLRPLFTELREDGAPRSR